MNSLPSIPTLAYVGENPSWGGLPMAGRVRTRHTLGRLAAETGADMDRIANILDHSSRVTAKHYVEFGLEEARQMQERVWGE